MIECLEPIIDTRAKILILGSMPGEQSLRLQQYYANPRNHFWGLMSAALGCSLQGGYEERVEGLQQHGVALWDVLAECERKGSLDSAIRRERANEIGALLARYSSIGAIFFNGGKAEQSFKRSGEQGQLPSGIAMARLPSSSPTPGRNVLGFAEKATVWASAIRPMLLDIGRQGTEN